MSDRNKNIILVFIFIILCTGCIKEPIPTGPVEDDSLIDIPYNPTAFEIEYPVYTRQILGNDVDIPRMEIPDDNPMTEEGIELGRHLFFDKILSGDGTQSCASCHFPEAAFTDNLPVSFGIDGIAGNRSSMSLYNIGFNNNGFFWDGRSATLEEQALLPIEDEIELHHSWRDVVEDLKNHDNYPQMFRKAFGIVQKSEITKELAAKAIAQFERSIYSFDSKLDKYLKGEIALSDEELYGLELYFEIPGTPDAQCAHCHSIPMMTSNEYFNNGLQEATTLLDFHDLGRGKVTGNIAENGFFRTPTLRNVSLSAPYMHDGSIESLDEVIDHYISGGLESPNKDPNVKDVQISNNYEKLALLAFIEAMTDTSYLQLERMQNPFE